MGGIESTCFPPCYTHCDSGFAQGASSSWFSDTSAPSLKLLKRPVGMQWAYYSKSYQWTCTINSHFQFIFSQFLCWGFLHLWCCKPQPHHPPFRFRYRVETHQMMKFAVCLSVTEKAELNIHKTPHFSQFRSITMLIIHTVSAGTEQKKSVEDRTYLDQPQLVSFCCWWQSHFHSSFVHPGPPHDCWKDWDQYNSQNNQHCEKLWESWTRYQRSDVWSPGGWRAPQHSHTTQDYPHRKGILSSSTWRISCQL